MMIDVIERLCQEAEREQMEGNERVAQLLWSIAKDFEDEAAARPKEASE